MITKPPVSRTQRFVQFALVRGIIALVMVVGAVAVVKSGTGQLERFLFDADDVPALWERLMKMPAMLTALGAFYAYVRSIERRSVSELSRARSLPELAIGCAIGAGLIGGVVAVLWALGYYHVIDVVGVSFLILPILDAVFAAVYEEIVFRGIIFRLVEERLGSWLAILLSGLLFGFAHATEPNATVLSSLALSLMGGVFLSAAYMYTRRLWFVIGVHFAWNFTEGGILGLAVSGKEWSGVLQSEITGPNFISGGRFGPEASIVTVLIVSAAGLYLLWKSKERGHFVRAFWMPAKWGEA